MRALTVCLVCLTASTVFAQDTPGPATEVKIYRVADLVARSAVKQSAVYRSATHEEWSSEHPRSIESLSKLAKLIETIVPADTGAVAAHEDSLSLVIRHTADGHAQVASLLDQLREQDQPTIELTLIPLYSLFKSYDSLPEKQQVRLQTLLLKQVLNEQETKEITDLLESMPADADTEIELYTKPFKARLVNGRKTQLRSYTMPIFATVVMPKGGAEFLVRIDNIADGVGDDSERMMGHTHTFTVPDGHSAIFSSMIGGEMVWLAIPKRIEPEQKMTATSGEFHE